MHLHINIFISLIYATHDTLIPKPVVLVPDFVLPQPSVLQTLVSTTLSTFSLYLFVLQQSVSCISLPPGLSPTSMLLLRVDNVHATVPR